MPETSRLRDPLESVLIRLHEAHDLSAYEAVDRLVHAGEAAGFDEDTLLRMLDQGIAFQKLLELIASKAFPIASVAPLESKRKSELKPQVQPEKAPPEGIAA